ncbi:MAG TPA: protein phosphatase 2C domain-containing protein [Alphaproteobacteria bacterium]|nr:protein phosphatase 2C domain-containing protein [Alphaproteobacteria bacterium]
MIQGRHFASEQSQGARDYQEDDAGFCPIGEGGADGLLMVLADGMGGHRGGAHASTVAVETFIDSFNHESGSIAERLVRALEDANDRVGKDSQENPELEGMGCTLVGVSLTEVGIEWISVGDSPMWLARNGKLQRLNADHSMAPILAKQVELGELSEDEAKRHPQRNALRSAVIGDTLQQVDTSKRPMKFRKGDRLLLASDGLETLSVEEIAAIIEKAGEVEAENLAKSLVAAVDARQRKGQDNTTVMVIDPYVGGMPAFGVVDPNAITERVTLRTGPPSGASEKTIKTAPAKAPPKAPKKNGAGRAMLFGLLVVAGALAAAALVFPDLIDSLLNRGGAGTTAASTTPSTASGTTASPATASVPGTARPDSKQPEGGGTVEGGGDTSEGKAGDTGADRPRTTPSTGGTTDRGARRTPGGARRTPGGAQRTPGRGGSPRQAGGSSKSPVGKAKPAPGSGGASGRPGGGSSKNN